MKTTISSAVALIVLAALACNKKSGSGVDQGGSAPAPPTEDKEAREKADEAKKEAEEAKRKLEEMQKKQARADAPKKVTASSLGCQCAAGKKIIISCQVVSKAEVPVSVDVSATGKTQTLASSSWQSTGQTKTSLPVGGQKTVQVETTFNGLFDCTAAGSCSCAIAQVTPSG